MNFDLTAEQRELQTSIAETCKRWLSKDDDLDQRDRECQFSRELWARCAALGVIGMTLPVEDGGLAADAVSCAIAMEALGRGCPDTGLLFSLAAHSFACVMPLHRFGSAEQKARWLGPMLAGTTIAAHGISEPEAGSDIFALRTQARKDGDDYVLSGQKCFCTNAPEADLFVVQARTSAGRGYFSLSAFLVERGTPGLEIGGRYEKVGLRTSPMGDVFFDDCRVPASSRLGPEGGGGTVFMHSMNWERTCLFAIYVGAMQRQLDATVEFARTRQTFGKNIGSFQAVSHRIVDMKIRVETARLLLYKAAWCLDHHPSDQVTPAMAKVYISEAAVQLGLDAVQIHGGLGCMTGELERLVRDAIPARIFSGTSEIQRNNIARALRL